MVNAPEVISVENWSHFCRACNELEGCGQDTNDAVIFRGHQEAGWELRSSLARETLRGKETDHGEKTNQIEEALKDAFVSKWFLDEMKPYLEHRALLRMLYIMQHYGIKTRMLDWTLSWKVAAYFATEEGEDNADGAVWCLNQTQVENRFRDICQQYKDRSQCAGRSVGHNYCWDVTNANKCPVRKPNNEIQCNGVFFKDVLSSSTDVRMLIQASIFTYCPNPLADHLECIAKVLGEDTKKYCKKMIITRALKPQFRNQLRRSHYTREKLFPVINQEDNREILEVVMKRFSEETRHEK